MHRQIIQVDAQVIKEELPPQLLEVDLELWDVDGFLEQHDHIYTIFNRDASYYSNCFCCILLIVYVDLRILLAVFMGRDGRSGHHHLINIYHMEPIINACL